MRIQEIISKKRDGGALTPAEIDFFVQGYTRGEIADYQASALLMAIYLRDMDVEETAALTASMAASGRQLDLSSLIAAGRPTLDKHSTGGVGDKASLVVVPILAAAGAYVCKMSGRGLGHTGGTLDKLESIPGFRVGLSPEVMLAQVRGVGACLAGQTADLAPADKKLYALRDATATVGSLPLIVSSILSKKLAGGAQAFLFDVKAGNGALMTTVNEARALAQALVAGAAQNGRRAVAVLSDMSQPLGDTIGNALEVAEAIATLTPGTKYVNFRFRTLCIELATEGILLAGLEESKIAAKQRAESVLANGAALGVFRDIVRAQGGDASVVDYPERLPKAPVIRSVPASQGGYIASIDTRALGEIVVALGGGRAKKEDHIDPAVGLRVHVALGDRIGEAAPLAEIHARSEEDAEMASTRVMDAFHLAEQPTTSPPLILEIIGF